MAEKLTYEELEKKVKKLDCLYAISDLVEKPDTSLSEILQGVVHLIPPSWQYPEITCAKIITRATVNAEYWIGGFSIRTRLKKWDFSLKSFFDKKGTGHEGRPEFL